MSCRVLDPILYDLMDPTIRRTPTIISTRGKELQGFLYERTFDQRYIGHLLDILLSVIRFGGLGFAKTAKSTPVNRSLHGGLIGRMASGIHSIILHEAIVSLSAQLALQIRISRTWMSWWICCFGKCYTRCVMLLLTSS